MHPMHHIEPESTPTEYAKFIAVIIGILVVSYSIAAYTNNLTWTGFAPIFMGVFFLVFGMFKLLDLRGFVMSYIGYDIIAKRWMGYAYAYPFIELGLAAGYFFAIPYTDWATLVLMCIGSIGVFRELLRGSTIKCACLGTYIKLPLTTVSLVENLAMGIMALIMIINNL